MTNLAFFWFCFAQGFVSIQSSFNSWSRLMGSKPSQVRNCFFYEKLNGVGSRVPSLIKFSEKHEPDWHFLDWIGYMEVYQCPRTALYWVVYRNNGYGGMQPARTYQEMLEVCAEMEATCW